MNDNAAMGEDTESEEFLGVFGCFIPELTKENIQLLINLFNPVGLWNENVPKCDNVNMLVILRFFHNLKYTVVKKKK